LKLSTATPAKELITQQKAIFYAPRIKITKYLTSKRLLKPAVPVKEPTTRLRQIVYALLTLNTENLLFLKLTRVSNILLKPAALVKEPTTRLRQIVYALITENLL